MLSTPSQYKKSWILLPMLSHFIKIFPSVAMHQVSDFGFIKNTQLYYTVSDTLYV